MSIEAIKESLQWHLMTLRPTNFLRSKIQSVDDLVMHRSFLRNACCTISDLNHLLDLVQAALSTKRRFRQADSLHVLKRIIKQRYLNRDLPKRTTDRIFSLYRHYVFFNNEEIQWAVSVMLKDRLLRDEQVQWLIEHYDESTHVLNRLLRYPRPHSLIQKWASNMFSDPKALPERRAELLGILINDKIPRLGTSVDDRVLAWAIYYSTASDGVKVSLLGKHATVENLWDVVDIAKRCNYPSLIESILASIDAAN